jgi:hypothetical protein
LIPRRHSCFTHPALCSSGTHTFDPRLMPFGKTVAKDDIPASTLLCDL